MAGGLHVAVGSHTFVVRARTPPCFTLMSAVSSIRLAPTARQPFVTLTVFVALPFSSSSVLELPTGTFFQLRLVDDPGGRAVRVKRGASVLAVGQGRCWVCISCVLPLTMAPMLARGSPRRGGGAMVARDGHSGQPALMHRACDVVGPPVDALPCMRAR